MTIRKIMEMGNKKGRVSLRSPFSNAPRITSEGIVSPNPNFNY